MNYNSENIKKDVMFRNKEYIIDFNCNNFIKFEKVYFNIFRSKLNTAIKVNIFKILELHQKLYSLSSVISLATICLNLIALEKYINSYKQTNNEFKMTIEDFIRVFGFLYKLKEVVLSNDNNRNRLKKILIRLIIMNHQYSSEIYFMFFHLLDIKEKQYEINKNYLINEYDFSDAYECEFLDTDEYDFYDTQNIEQILDF
mgnify:CR=1 FL=1